MDATVEMINMLTLVALGVEVVMGMHITNDAETAMVVGGRRGGGDGYAHHK